MNLRPALLVLALSACGGGGTPPAVEIPDTTHVLDDATRAALISYDQATGTIVAHAPAFADLTAGDIVVSAPVPAIAPAGFLRKVVSVSTSGGQVTLTTGPAALDQAIKTGSLQATIPVDPSMIDMSRTTVADPSIHIVRNAPLIKGMIPPGHGLVINFDHTHLAVNATDITLNGSIVLDANFNADLSINFFDLQHFLFTVDFAEDTDVHVDGTLGIDHEFDIPITEMFFTPIDIQIGPVPVVFTPKCVLELGIKPTVGLTVADLHFTSSGDVNAGIEFRHDANPQWSSYANANATGTTDLSAFPQFAVSVDVYPHAESEVLLYNSAGPYIYNNIGLIADAATPRHPFLKAGVHVEVGAGGKVDLVDGGLLNLLDYSTAIFDQIFWFFQTPNIPPILDLHSPPVAGLDLAVGQPLAMHADAYDLEDGRVADGHLNVTWTSDLDGALGTGTDPLPVQLHGGPGTRTITVTATDSDGGTTIRTSPVTIDHVLPTGQITAPSSRVAAYVGRALPLSAAVSDVFEPLTDVCTVSGFSFAWSSTDASDVIANPTACPSSGTTITFANAGVTRTVSLAITDPWGGVTTVQSVYTPQNQPPGTLCPTIDSITQQELFTGDGQNIVTPPIPLSGSIATGCTAPSGTVTYTWTAIGHHADGSTVSGDIGTGNGLSWQPVNTAGVVDDAATFSSVGEQIEVLLHAADTAGDSGDAQPVTIRLQSVPG